MICAGVACGAPGGAVGVTRVSLGCVAGGTPPAGVPVVTGGMPGGTTPVGGGVAGGGAGAAGFSGTGAIGVGTGDVAGGTGGFTTWAPGPEATGGRGTPPGETPGVVGITWVTPPIDGTVAGTSSGEGAMSGGGPPSPRFCCVPM